MVEDIPSTVYTLEPGQKPKQLWHIIVLLVCTEVIKEI